MNEDPLIAAASRLGIATHTSAGPGHGPAGKPIWANWPRPRLDIAREALEEVIQHDRTAGLAPTGESNRWRAYCAGWSYEGEFVDAVASLALHFSICEEAKKERRGKASGRPPSSRSS
jgi:hypothetical protein